VREHGTLSMYRYCKCEKCRAAMAGYNKAYKSRKTEAFDQEVARIFQEERGMAKQRPLRMRKPPSWMHDGVTCDYHSVITGPVTAAGVVIKGEPFQDASGRWVIGVVGRAGYFAIEAFSKSKLAVA